MSKVTLSNLTDLQNETTAVNTINSNNTAITTALDNTLSRDGTSPNPMGSNLDMNSNRILNLSTPLSASEPVRLSDLQTITGGGTISINAMPAGGASGTVLRKSSSSDFDATWSKMVLTNPATVSTLTIANNKTFTVNNTLTLAGTDSTTITFQATDTYVGRATTDTLTNKTFDTAGTGNVFKINGTTITANTGSGNNVLDTSPTLTSPTFVTPAIGVATGTSLAVTGLLKSSSSSAGIGYATGAGSTVTQATSKTTGVTINTLTGTITTNNQSMASGGVFAFTVTNSSVGANDTIILCLASGGTSGAYRTAIEAVAAGSFRVQLFNGSGGALAEALVLNYVIIKGVAS